MDLGNVHAFFQSRLCGNAVELDRLLGDLEVARLNNHAPVLHERLLARPELPGEAHEAWPVRCVLNVRIRIHGQPGRMRFHHH